MGEPSATLESLGPPRSNIHSQRPPSLIFGKEIPHASFPPMKPYLSLLFHDSNKDIPPYPTESDKAALKVVRYLDPAVISTTSTEVPDGLGTELDVAKSNLNDLTREVKSLSDSITRSPKKHNGEALHIIHEKR